MSSSLLLLLLLHLPVDRVLAAPGVLSSPVGVELGQLVFTLERSPGQTWCMFTMKEQLDKILIKCILIRIILLNIF